MNRTSQTHPLRIDSFPLHAGRVGLTFCPGKLQPEALTGGWARCLEADLDVISDFGADTLITLMEHSELTQLNVSELQRAASMRMPLWLHLPFPDGDVPDYHWLKQWQVIRLVLAKKLLEGKNIVIHCKGGLGRTGLVAGLLLKDAGLSAAEAVSLVRGCRPGTIENTGQERFVHAYAPEFEVTSGSVYNALGLLAGMAGDALGYEVEFDQLSTIKQRFGEGGLTVAKANMNGYIVVSDDTQMTLATLAAMIDGGQPESLVSARGLLPHVLRAYVAWYQLQTGAVVTEAGPALQALVRQRFMRASRAPGNTCMAALEAVVQGHQGAAINSSKGCGTIMRVLPVAWLADAREAEALAYHASALTHGHPMGWLPSMLFVRVIRQLVNTKGSLQSILEQFLQDKPFDKELMPFVRGALSEDPIRAQGWQGWVADEALGIALWAARQAEGRGVAAAMEAAANHDGDSDSTASLAGQLAALREDFDSELIRFVTQLDAFESAMSLLALYWGAESSMVSAAASEVSEYRRQSSVFNARYSKKLPLAIIKGNGKRAELAAIKR